MRSASSAVATRGSATLPSKSMKNMYSQGRLGRGRDSSFVRDTPYSASTCRQRKSAPFSCRVDRIKLVLHDTRSSTGTGARASAT